jgi:hypothetical protein
MFGSDFDRVVGLNGSREAVQVWSVAMLETGGCTFLLLRGATWTGEGCGSPVSTSEDSSRPPKDAFLETFGRR